MGRHATWTPSLHDVTAYHMVQLGVTIILVAAVTTVAITTVYIQNQLHAQCLKQIILYRTARSVVKICAVSLMVMIPAFQAGGPGSIP